MATYCGENVEVWKYGEYSMKGNVLIFDGVNCFWIPLSDLNS